MTVYRLEPGVQHYAWGDTHFIPDLLGIENLERVPYAELWLGTHPDLPAHVVAGGRRRLLSDLLEEELPYLMKILSAAKPLSIQVHPDERQARDGFARESSQGIAMGAPNRSYKDERGKPEILCALTDFYALVGFRPDPPPFEDGSLQARYERLMMMPQDEVDAVLEPRIDALSGRDFTRDDREYWILRCHEEFSEPGHYDRGLFSLDLLNLIRLEPGEAVYLGAGTLHAYLEGTGVELMASSNNVLRGGLTNKHVDVAELLRIVRFESEAPDVVRGVEVNASEWSYPTPAREFELRRIDVSQAGHESTSDHGPEILIVVEGEAVIGPYHVRRGQSVCVPRGEAYTVEGSATIYEATVPRGAE